MPIERVVVSRDTKSQRLQEIIDLCRQKSVPVRFESRKLVEKLAGGGVHQGIIAVGASRHYADLDDVITGNRMIVVLDGVEDPHNLGAIIRTVNAAGAGAVVIAERRASGLTETVAKASAGALAWVPVVRVANIARTLERLKKARFWIYGLDQAGEHSYDTVEYVSPSALVVGSEGKGIHRNVRRQCDFLIRIPMVGEIASLNVSVATGIALFDWKRRTQGEEQR